MARPALSAAGLAECPVCGLVYEQNAGDTWAFWIIGDRIPIGAAIAVLYFGFRPQTWLQVVVFAGALGTALIGTIPHRRGVVIALDYLSRLWWPDRADVLPSAPSTLHATAHDLLRTEAAAKVKDAAT